MTEPVRHQAFEHFSLLVAILEQSEQRLARVLPWALERAAVEAGIHLQVARVFEPGPAPGAHVGVTLKQSCFVLLPTRVTRLVHSPATFANSSSSLGLPRSSAYFGTMRSDGVGVMPLKVPARLKVKHRPDGMLYWQTDKLPPPKPHQ